MLRLSLRLLTFIPSSYDYLRLGRGQAQATAALLPLCHATSHGLPCRAVPSQLLAKLLPEWLMCNADAAAVATAVAVVIAEAARAAVGRWFGRWVLSSRPPIASSSFATTTTSTSSSSLPATLYYTKLCDSPAVAAAKIKLIRTVVCIVQGGLQGKQVPPAQPTAYCSSALAIVD